ncbi:hypothetical protein Q3G72_035374 [Acer saccharum]|nr:hypothetical protein Q3G72_035374 [Acer saccharum]
MDVEYVIDNGSESETLDDDFIELEYEEIERGEMRIKWSESGRDASFASPRRSITRASAPITTSYFPVWPAEIHISHFPESFTKSQNIPPFEEGIHKRTIRSGEDVDAPLQSGIVRVFEQPGIEDHIDEDDFIEVRSRRQMLNDRHEQREKEIKAKSRVTKVLMQTVFQFVFVTCFTMNKTLLHYAVFSTFGGFSAPVSGEAANSIHSDLVGTEGRNLANTEFGEIPSSIGGLYSLINFSIAQNKLQGTIPELFGNLVSLEILDLSSNNLSGTIPKSIEKLRYLRGDFDIAKLLGEEDSMAQTHTLATIGYMAPGTFSTIEKEKYLQKAMFMVTEVVDSYLLIREDEHFAAKEHIVCYLS